jgi:transcriptional regulator with XRE-family HTH domain
MTMAKMKLLINPLAVEIGERIRKYRELHDISQRELSDRTGVPQPQLSRYERGTDLPGLDVVARLAAFMDYSLDYLYYGRVEEIAGKLDPMLRHQFLRLHEFSEACRRAVSDSADAHMSREIMEKRALQERKKNADTGVTPGKPKLKNDRDDS